MTAPSTARPGDRFPKDNRGEHEVEECVAEVGAKLVVWRASTMPAEPARNPVISQ